MRLITIVRQSYTLPTCATTNTPLTAWIKVCVDWRCQTRAAWEEWAAHAIWLVRAFCTIVQCNLQFQRKEKKKFAQLRLVAHPVGAYHFCSMKRLRVLQFPLKRDATISWFVLCRVYTIPISNPGRRREPRSKVACLRPQQIDSAKTRTQTSQSRVQR